MPYDWDFHCSESRNKCLENRQKCLTRLCSASRLGLRYLPLVNQLAGLTRLWLSGYAPWREPSDISAHRRALGLRLRPALHVADRVTDKSQIEVAPAGPEKADRSEGYGRGVPYIFVITPQPIKHLNRT